MAVINSAEFSGLRRFTLKFQDVRGGDIQSVNVIPDTTTYTVNLGRDITLNLNGVKIADFNTTKAKESEVLSANLPEKNIYLRRSVGGKNVDVGASVLYKNNMPDLFDISHDFNIVPTKVIDTKVDQAHDMGLATSICYADVDVKPNYHNYIIKATQNKHTFELRCDIDASYNNYSKNGSLYNDTICWNVIVLNSGS